MKRIASVVLLAAFAGGAIACPDEAKDAKVATGLVSSKLAETQPQMSRAPAATPSVKAAVATPIAAKVATPTTAAAETPKKAPSGG
jgi:hypothetical protein